jgi:Domain of unknown function (DUF4169)
MAEIVNLNRARKDRARLEARATAATNRVVHGRTKSERATSQAERERAERLIDGHKLGDEDS